MGTAVVLGRLADLYLVREDGSLERFAGRSGEDASLGPPAALVRSLSSLPPTAEVVVDTEARRDWLAQGSRRAASLASIPDLRRARAILPLPKPDLEREAILALAAQRLETVLASPEEVLISLAREEERLERAVGREARAAESFLASESSALAEYAEAWAQVRRALETHLAGLQTRTGAQARRVVPNLSAVVGERVAARLVASAGGVGALARMRSARLQLLGSRRRPSPEHGPRFGVLYRADRMGDVPADRRGAYARSLAALAAIAVRADATTRANLRERLVARRDRRVERLQREGR